MKKIKGEIILSALITISLAFATGIVSVYFRNADAIAQNKESILEMAGDLRVLNTKLDYLLNDKGAMYNPEVGAVVRVSTSSLRK